jgi:hypothetical protein
MLSRKEAQDRGFCYIAGPYRSINGWIGVETNINTARYWAKQLAEASIPIFNPHMNSAHFEDIAPDVPDSFWLQMDATILAHARAIFFLPNWATSAGARQEYDWATEWDIPKFYCNGEVQGLGALIKWWKGGSS